MFTVCIVLLIISSGYASSDTLFYPYTNNITDLTIFGSEIWCSTTGGVVHWNIDTGIYEEFTLNDGLPCDQPPGKLGMDSHGHIWVSWNGIYRYNGTSWEHILTDLPDFTAFAAESDGSVWLGCDRQRACALSK